MAFDKKPSMYSDRGSIGTANELDAYGVWVKSEPQDLAAGLASVMGFDGEAMPFEDDFDTGFDDIDSPLGTPEVDVSGLGADSSGFDVDDFSVSGYEDLGFDKEPVDEPFADTIRATVHPTEHTKEEVSTQLLMKIADELSSIRSELSTLKKEFNDIRSEKKNETEDQPRSGFFADEEKDALTGDEIENILSSSEIEEPFAFDPLRDEDEAALSELSIKNEAAGETEETEIDFDDLGINLGDAGETDMPGVSEFLADEELLGSDALSESGFSQFDEDFTPDTGLEELGELQELRREGASPLAPAPENTTYLEDDPFAIDHIESAASSRGGNSLELNLDDAAFDINLDDLEISSPSLPEEDFSEEISFEKDSPDLAAVIETPDLVTGLDESAPAEPALDVSLDINDFAEDVPPLEEPPLEGPPLVELTLEEPPLEEPTLEELVLDEPPLEEPTLEELVLEPPLVELTLDEPPSEEPALEDLTLEPPLVELTLDESPLEEPPSEEPALEELALEPPLVELTLDEPPSEEPALEDLALEPSLVELTLDEPPLEEPPSEEIALEEPALEEPELEVALEMGNLTTEIQIDEPAEDDSIAKVIPEALEINIDDTAISFDDDLDAFSEEDTAAEASSAKADAFAEVSGKSSVIPPDLKSELKEVLSYMDNLLESLPEEKIEEFAHSEYFETYKKIFKELGLEQ